MTSKTLDAILEWSPFIGVLTTGMISHKMNASGKQRLLLVGGNIIVHNAIVRTLKKVVPEQRPEPSIKRNSFPSGHTATAFAGAEMLRRETQSINPSLSYAGYVIAMITGIRRIRERKHWLHDVIAGAVIGIVSTHITYWLNEQASKKF